MAEPANATDNAREETEETTLIEDISIDGMCGVY
jgi:mycofactocin precursor